jgi:phospholipase C
MAVGVGVVDHVVVLMLENRSFDHMLGFLYAGNGNKSPSGQEFDGLTGNESNPGPDGDVKVFPIDASKQYAYFMPGADPGEGYLATNAQLYGTTKPASGAVPGMDGFVNDFAYTLKWEASEKLSILPGTTPASIMGCFPPEMLPVLSGLARGYAVSDRWFGSVPTETLPNRFFALQATSQGYMDDKTRQCSAPSIFSHLQANGHDWTVYGYTSPPLTRESVIDIRDAPDSRFGLFSDFQAAAAAGKLSAFTFLEPSWGSKGNSQHPNYDVALGEQLIHDAYYAVRNGPGWEQTLLVITYDEHGGLYDHVPPPGGATPPDSTPGEYEFDFTRFGPRVPTVLVSPYIEAGTVLRAPDGGPPFDHTSVLKTLETRFGVPPLTARDAAAPDVAAAFTLEQARDDDPLQGVQPPSSGVAQSPAEMLGAAPGAEPPSHLQEVQAELVQSIPPRRDDYHRPPPRERTALEYDRYIKAR